MPKRLTYPCLDISKRHYNDLIIHCHNANRIHGTHGSDPSTKLQEIMGTLLYYGRAVDPAMVVALGKNASAQSKGTEATTQAITQLLKYTATYPDATIGYIASDVYLHIHSDASYLSEAEARSRAGGDFFLSSKPSDPSKAPDLTDMPPPHTHTTDPST
jgi:hypothetical protein